MRFYIAMHERVNPKFTLLTQWTDPIEQPLNQSMCFDVGLVKQNI